MVPSSFPLLLPHTPSFSLYLLPPQTRKRDNFPVFKKYSCLSESKKHTGAGFLHAQVVLKNNHRRDFKCQYCFEWRDKNGMIQKHAATSWRPVLIHGREVVELDAVSPVSETESFRLKIRRDN